MDIDAILYDDDIYKMIFHIHIGIKFFLNHIYGIDFDFPL